MLPSPWGARFFDPLRALWQRRGEREWIAKTSVSQFIWKALYKVGVVGFFGFADLANFWFSFSVFALLKAAVFQFWCFARFAGRFLQFSLQFSVFVINDGGFSDFNVQCFYGFGDFAKEAAVALKCKGPLLWHTIFSFRGMDDKPSLLSSPVTAANCNQTMKSSRSYQSERLFLKYHAAGIISSGLWPSTISSSCYRLMSFHRRNNSAFTRSVHVE